MHMCLYVTLTAALDKEQFEKCKPVLGESTSARVRGIVMRVQACLG